MEGTKPGDHWGWRSRETRLFLVCGALAAIALLVVIPSRIFENGYLNYVSGAWAALADDVSHGVLYRPLVSELGYGGTRYFPLYFVIHGVLHSLGLSLIAAGHLINLLSAVSIVAGGAVGLRRQGVPWPLAWTTGVLALASRTAFVGIAGIRGDIFPLALGVLGLAWLPRSRSESMLLPATLLALSVLAKPTLVWAPAAAVLAIALVHALSRGSEARDLGRGGHRRRSRSDLRLVGRGNFWCRSALWPLREGSHWKISAHSSSCGPERRRGSCAPP